MCLVDKMVGRFVRYKIDAAIFMIKSDFIIDDIFVQFHMASSYIQIRYTDIFKLKSIYS